MQPSCSLFIASSQLRPTSWYSEMTGATTVCGDPKAASASYSTRNDSLVDPPSLDGTAQLA